MNLRRVTAETVRQWQAQAELVCRIPHLRGHDAQLLVACNLTSPEILASMTPESVLEQVTDYVQTSAARGTARRASTDLTEVSRWIACRSVPQLECGLGLVATFARAWYSCSQVARTWYSCSGIRSSIREPPSPERGG